MTKKGYKQTNEHKRNISLSNKNKKLSEEHKQKISKGLRGKKKNYCWNRGLPKEQQPFFNKKHTTNTKLKMSYAHRGKAKTLIHRKRLSDALKGKSTYHNKNEKSWNWKGDNVGYKALRSWIGRNKEKPLFCEICKKVPPYDLANISGEYKRDIKDFEWLCRKCHILKDGRLKNLKQYGDEI